MRYLVAIPVYNEAPTVHAVLQEVRRHAPDILIIDDGSTDHTPALLAREPDLAVIRHTSNRGYGQSLIDAFKYARDAKYDWLITMDCDEQHEPARIPVFLRAAADDDADIISGSRYLAAMNGNSRPPVDRLAINQGITDLLNELLNMNISDAFCGFKAYRVAALKDFDLTVPGYGMPLQFWVQTARLGLRIREIPVRLIYNDPSRHFGGSLDDPDKRLLYYYQVLVHEMARWAREADARLLPANRQTS
ncbi:MAG TPA: glycosyltransferase family 2 protein [Phycisphaerae bacterium]|nr:glycosyltransferase family 2 protein [Phycisphaerae bacterium]